MSSRPSKFYTWCSVGTNYPSSANPWSTQVTVSLPGLDYFTPGVAIPAENLNYALNAAGAANNSLLSYVGQVDVMNWSSVIQVLPSSSYLVSGFPKYDPYSGRWLFSLSTGTGGTTGIYATTDGGATFNQIGNVGTAPGGMICPSNGAVFAWQGASNSAVLNPATQTWTTVTGPTIGGSAPIFVGKFFDSLYVVILSSSSTVSAFHSPDGVTWTQAGSPFPETTVGVGSYYWHLADNGSNMLVAMGNSQASYYSTTDGQTWTTRTMPTLGGSEFVVSVDYDSSDNLFYMATATASVTRIWKSTDGITWTVTGTLNYLLTGFFCRGSMLVGLATMQQSVARVIFSLNGGTSWAHTQAPVLDMSYALLKGDANWMLFYATVGGAKCVTSLLVGSGNTVN